MSKGKKSVTSLLKYHKDLEGGLRTESAQKYFNKMLEEVQEDYSNIELTDAEKDQLQKDLFLLKYGHGVFEPKKCDKNCTCSLKEMGKAPEGKPCPFEIAFIGDRFKFWAETFQQNEIDVENPLYQTYISELAYLDNLIHRCAQALATTYQTPIVESVSGVTKSGDVLIELIENPVIGVMDKLEARKNKLLNDLVLTPRESYKRKVALKIKTQDDYASIQAAKRVIEISSDDLMEAPDHLSDDDE